MAKKTLFCEGQSSVKTIGHRGVSGYAPENTMAAFEKAVEMNLDCIELDVQMSKDGKLVIIHDDTIDRTTNGSGNVSDFTLNELRRFDAGSWFHIDFTGERIATLEEVLDQFWGRIGFLIELKSPSLYPGMEQNLAEALKRKAMNQPERGSLLVQSFDLASLQTVHRCLPNVAIGVLVNKRQRVTVRMLQQLAIYADYVNPHRSEINAARVRRIHRFGMGVVVWNVNRRKEIPPLLRAGVDGIISNFPDYVFENKEINRSFQ